LLIIIRVKLKYIKSVIAVYEIKFYDNGLILFCKICKFTNNKIRWKG